jgi:hypothetical protein
LKQGCGGLPKTRGIVLACIQSGELHVAGEPSAVEVRHEPACGTQQRGLTMPRELGDQTELSSLDLQAASLSAGCCVPGEW